jgi:hypothetical protein
MVSLRLRTRKEEFEMIRERLAKKLRFDFTETPNFYAGHGKKFPKVNSIQEKLCKRLNRQAESFPVTSYTAWDIT